MKHLWGEVIEVRGAQRIGLLLVLTAILVVGFAGAAQANTRMYGPWKGIIRAVADVGPAVYDEGKHKYHRALVDVGIQTSRSLSCATGKVYTSSGRGTKVWSGSTVVLQAGTIAIGYPHITVWTGYVLDVTGTGGSGVSTIGF
jgi:hypothetical protein